MANKLRSIFSKEMYNIGLELGFEDENASREFQKILNVISEEGRSIEVKGINSLKTKISDENMSYPIAESDKIKYLVAGPSYKEIPFDYDTRYGKKRTVLKGYRINKASVAETDENQIVYFRFEHPDDSKTFKLTYKIQPHFAMSINEIIESCYTSINFIDQIINSKGKKHSLINNMKKTILDNAVYYNQMLCIEQRLDVTFKPALLAKEEYISADIEELYCLLEKGAVIRFDAKLSADDTTSINILENNKEIKVGEVIRLTFYSCTSYDILGYKFSIHNANLLSNAIVKEIEQLDGGKVKIVYDQNDSQPMFISYKGFLTEQAAIEEIKKIMQNVEEYQNALTVRELLKGEAELIHL